MPVYSYKCRKCEHKFEKEMTISQKEENEVINCPECKSDNIFQTFDRVGLLGGSKNSSCSGSCPADRSCCD
ncbi:zinc ribbon domain-containing protein [Halanaerobiaceae bacterium Z-7014]|uniref:Zinc ribbon domain-containing protein n=1 Tax=Halonatronomonas betaini TaxID=2778430 RepID=A0A931F5D8_9FIRM|nr:FmdB family zinc ribbon protein [Halonatronomonas betaini]MBF8435775.1 zinc ribbon domain-containing protein [Halonatronomonas betaini]